MEVFISMYPHFHCRSPCQRSAFLIVPFSAAAHVKGLHFLSFHSLPQPVSKVCISYRFILCRSPCQRSAFPIVSFSAAARVKDLHFLSFILCGLAAASLLDKVKICFQISVQGVQTICPVSVCKCFVYSLYDTFPI